MIQHIEKQLMGTFGKTFVKFSAKHQQQYLDNNLLTLSFPKSFVAFTLKHQTTSPASSAFKSTERFQLAVLIQPPKLQLCFQLTKFYFRNSVSPNKTLKTSFFSILAMQQYVQNDAMTLFSSTLVCKLSLLSCFETFQKSKLLKRHRKRPHTKAYQKKGYLLLLVTCMIIGCICSTPTLPSKLQTPQSDYSTYFLI